MAWFRMEILKCGPREGEGGQNQELIFYTERNRMPFDALILLDVMKLVLLHNL